MKMIPSLHTSRKADITVLFDSNKERDAFVAGILFASKHYDPLDIQHGNIPEGPMAGIPFCTPGGEDDTKEDGTNSKGI